MNGHVFSDDNGGFVDQSIPLFDQNNGNDPLDLAWGLGRTLSVIGNQVGIHYKLY